MDKKSKTVTKYGKRYFMLRLPYLAAALLLLSSCGSYKPPYERGYDKGYEDGYAAAGGDVSDMPEKEVSGTGEGAEDKAEETAEDAGAKEEKKTHEKSGLSNLISSKKDKDSGEKEEAAKEESAEAAASSAENTPAEEAAPAEQEKTEVTVQTETQSTEAQEANVLGEGSEPVESSAGSGGGIPEGRIISAEAVNEALFSHPEVIEGLRDIYPDVSIFGEYVGDSETNLIHKVNGPHFGELRFNTIVVYDGSRSLDDILNEGFFSKCSCCDQ